MFTGDVIRFRLVRRVVAGVTSVVLLAGVMTVLQVGAPAVACACGAPAPVMADPNGDVRIGQEYAVISHQGTKEQVDMRLAMETLARDSGLIMPTPAPATVSLGDASVFETLATEMTPTVVTKWEWWASQWKSGSMNAAGGMDGAAAPGSPVVLDVVQLGPLEATTLAASNTQGLIDWLDAHGYGLRPEVTDLLRGYVDRGWYFVAMKLTSEDGLDGDLDPIRFVFDTPASGLVYPLALSQAARIEQMVNLYIFDDHRRDIQFANGKSIDYMTGGIPTWAGPVKQEALQSYGSYLTSYTLRFISPSQQILDDLSFPQAPNDEEYGTVIYRTEYLNLIGIPLGWVIVVIVAVGAIVVGTKLASRRH